MNAINLTGGNPSRIINVVVVEGPICIFLCPWLSKSVPIGIKLISICADVDYIECQ